MVYFGNYNYHILLYFIQNRVASVTGWVCKDRILLPDINCFPIYRLEVWVYIAV